MTELISLSIPDVVSTALLVIAGKYGVDPERKEKLTAEGHNAKKVQECVNELIQLFCKYEDA